MSENTHKTDDGLSTCLVCSRRPGTMEHGGDHYCPVCLAARVARGDEDEDTGEPMPVREAGLPWLRLAGLHSPTPRGAAAYMAEQDMEALLDGRASQPFELSEAEAWLRDECPEAADEQISQALAAYAEGVRAAGVLVED